MVKDRPLRFVDISGFGYCGKGVLTDLLREVRGFHVPNRFFEFNLLRIQGGLLDLGHALGDGFSLIRADAALRRYERVSRICGTVARLFAPKSIAVSNGMSYDKYFRGRFLTRTGAYVESLTETAFEVDEWPYVSVDESGWVRAGQRIMRNLRIKREFPRTVRVVRRGRFLPLTRDYLDDLYRVHAEDGVADMVLHNSFEPFAPSASIELFHDARCLIMERDVRDIYVGSLRAEAYGGMVLKRSSWLGGSAIESFIQRQELLHEHMHTAGEDPSRVLRLTFEDAVLDYDRTRRRVFEFLGIDEKWHAEPRKYFDPDRSRRNLGLWKPFDDQSVIMEIENRLPDLCFQGIRR